jgi:hypothetical protein
MAGLASRIVGQNINLKTGSNQAQSSYHARCIRRVWVFWNQTFDFSFSGAPKIPPHHFSIISHMGVYVLKALLTSTTSRLRTLIERLMFFDSFQMIIGCWDMVFSSFGWCGAPKLSLHSQIIYSWFTCSGDKLCVHLVQTNIYGLHGEGSMWTYVNTFWSCIRNSKAKFAGGLHPWIWHVHFV